MLALSEHHLDCGQQLLFALYELHQRHHHVLVGSKNSSGVFQSGQCGLWLVTQLAENTLLHIIDDVKHFLEVTIRFSGQAALHIGLNDGS
jgi:hypothetical protein